MADHGSSGRSDRKSGFSVLKPPEKGINTIFNGFRDAHARYCGSYALLFLKNFLGSIRSRMVEWMRSAGDYAFQHFLLVPGWRFCVLSIWPPH